MNKPDKRSQVCKNNRVQMYDGDKRACDHKKVDHFVN